MANSSIVFAIFSMLILIAMPMIHASLSQDPKYVENWFKNLSNKKEKVTKFHYYFHDQVSGKNPTAFQVTQSNITSTSPSFFGMTMMVDDALTVGPDPNSEIVGRAQGFYASAGLNEISFLMNMNLVFTQGKYNGSTLSLQGWNPATHKYREMSIVGGSGVFRLARGIATASTFSVNFTSFDAVVEYHVIVLHY